mgnify:FL=1|tara:strand:- start:161205 stop:162035 length:831 start_codon:yes stop_codon:yes gene_type:complete
MTILFSRIRFIMVQPSHPGNVGAAARAIKTMGFTDLCLVNPEHDNVTRHPDAIALASGAGDVLEQASLVPNLEAALAPLTMAFAMTARERVLGPPVCDIREAAILSQSHVSTHPEGRVGIVLGTERSGLTNEHIAQCQRICHIPANPAYSSLNVAQALQLAAWELRYALSNMPCAAEKIDSPARINYVQNDHGETHPADPEAGDALASQAKINAFLKHWQEALIQIQFLNPTYPKKLIPRMHHLFGRNQMTNDEVDMMRGVCTAMVKAANGQLRKN